MFSNRFPLEFGILQHSSREIDSRWWPFVVDIRIFCKHFRCFGGKVRNVYEIPNNNFPDFEAKPFRRNEFIVAKYENIISK